MTVHIYVLERAKNGSWSYKIYYHISTDNRGRAGASEE